MRSLRTTILNNVHGLIHLRKIGYNHVSFDPSVLDSISPVFTPGPSSIWAFFYNETLVYHQPNAGDLPSNQNYLNPESDVKGGNIASTYYYYNPAEGPYLAYALLHLINPYDAANNPLGCINYDEDNQIPKSGGNISVSDEEFAVIRAKFLSATELDYTTYANEDKLVSDFAVCAKNATTSTGSANIGVYEYPIMANMWSKTTASSVWSNAATNLIAQLLSGGNSFGRTRPNVVR
jgi:hypothetical protein